MIACAMISLFMLAGCGGSDSGEFDEYIGEYTARSAEMSGMSISVENVVEGGFSIELKKKGKGTATISGESAGIKWTIDDDDFHAEGGGVTFDGTLKDGVMILENFDDSDITLTLVCDELAKASGNDDEDDGEEGGKKKGKKGSLFGKKGDDEEDEEDEDGGSSTADKLDGMLGGNAEDAGMWELMTVTEAGHTYMEDELKQKGIESWIQMDEDGTGTIDLVGQLMDMQWGDGMIVVPDNGEGEEEEYRYSINGGFLVLVDEDMTLAFRRVEGGSSQGSASGGDAVISEDLMRRYEGDWHGLLKYEDISGSTFKDYEGRKCDVVARICLDEDGNVTPFFANAMDEDPKTRNFHNLIAELDPTFDTMFISGEFLGGSFDTIAVSEEDGFLHASILLEADNGDTMTVEIGMKRPHAKWTDDDYPRYPDEGVEFYKGKSLEEIMSTFGNPPKSMPGQTHVTDWK